MIIGKLNKNSLRNKFESLVQQVTRNIDILLLSETKLDNNSPVTQILIDVYRLNRDNNGGDITLFIREDIPCKLLYVKSHLMEGFYVEVN